MNTVKISVWVSSEERQFLKDRAADAGLSLSKYLGTIGHISRSDHTKTIQSLYLKAGEAQTLADLVREQYHNQIAQNHDENLEGDIADLLTVTIDLRALIKDLLT
jgi:hypothetical protein